MIKITKTTKDEHTVYTLEAYKDNKLVYDDSVVEITEDNKLDETAVKKVLIMTLLDYYYPLVVDELVDRIQVKNGT